MAPYWTLLAFAALFSFRDLRMPVIQRAWASHLIVIVVVVALMVGLRYRVGGDWSTYDDYLDRARELGLGQALALKDPGYQLVNWLAASLGTGIWPVNLICGIIFSYGLFRFVRTLPSPTLAILVAIPYFVIVVAMGYTRQAAAIGFTMMALESLRSGRLVRVGLYFFLAVLFHRTAFVVVPLVGLSRARNRVPTLLAFGALALALYFAFVDSSVDTLVAGYVDNQYDSSGAAIRVSINMVPAILFLWLGKRFRLLDRDEWLLWRNFSLAALACLPALFLAGSTTVVDRLALYLIPLQLFVLSWLPHVIGRDLRDSRPMVAGIVLYSVALQFVWLNFAGHSRYWVPYQLYPVAIQADQDQ